MAEEDLKKIILGKIQREKEAILDQANEEADKILGQAREEASSVREDYLRELKRVSFLKKARELSEINLEVRRAICEEENKRILEAFRDADNELKIIRKDKNRYKSIFKNLLLEAQEGLGREAEVKIKINPQDRGLALELFKELKIGVWIETREDIYAGLELGDLEENIIILNTFASRLEKIMPQLRPEISKILFDHVL